MPPTQLEALSCFSAKENFPAEHIFPAFEMCPQRMYIGLTLWIIIFYFTLSKPSLRPIIYTGTKVVNTAHGKEVVGLSWSRPRLSFGLQNGDFSSFHVVQGAIIAID